MVIFQKSVKVRMILPAPLWAISLSSDSAETCTFSREKLWNDCLIRKNSLTWKES